jgi:large subunit ribosomal protein L6
MSRIGKKPVDLIAGAKASVAGNVITIEGPKGKLKFTHRPEVRVDVEGSKVTVAAEVNSRQGRAFHGLTRALIQNMVVGVTQGYEKKLEIVGVGYLASLKGKVLQLRVGYANELHIKIPDGITVTCPDQTHIVVQGCDKQQVGEFAASVRSKRKPEPYKGKGVRYQGEQIKLKPGKAASK